MLGHGTARSFARGEVVFAAGAAPDYLFIVLAGWIKLFRVTASGTEAVINVCGPGQSVGDTAILKIDGYLADAQAVSPCEVLQLPAQRIRQLMDECPRTREAVMGSTLVHLRELLHQVETLKVLNGAQRMAQFLLALAPPGQTGACAVHLPYGKLLIAGQIGISPESLSRAIKRLRSRGVRVDREIAWIDDVQALADFCGFAGRKCA
ncbi:Crp/Fnr family transcriptional regulator [Mangrovicoccus ximenensis]|uniref:Crp/Fnr family transcriptional regulator n=1 Tax=Mangrovicoccus ximenensis TaxID=1911570 RepID=UPI001374CB33|nr:Crp/Fnr family transcriptional regulator [Mangrovicoccus ximenensis]